MSHPSDAFLADVLAEPETLAAVLDAYGRSDGPLEAIGAVNERRVNRMVARPTGGCGYDLNRRCINRQKQMRRQR